jgi:hypothetical protein
MQRDKHKSIIEKFAETMRSLADSASEALNAEEPPKADVTAAACMPFAAEGLVSDPLLVPSVAAQPRQKRKRGAKTAKRSTATKKPSNARSVRRFAKTTRPVAAKRSARKAARDRGRQ